MVDLENLLSTLAADDSGSELVLRMTAIRLVWGAPKELSKSDPQRP